jgi:hypothetical protein
MYSNGRCFLIASGLVLKLAKDTNGLMESTINFLNHLPPKHLIQSLKLRQLHSMVPAGELVHPVTFLKPVAHLPNVVEVLSAQLSVRASTGAFLMLSR